MNFIKIIGHEEDYESTRCDLLLFAIFVIDNDTSTMSYVLKDHLGSMYATVTNGSVDYYSFDAWGRERNPNTFLYDNVPSHSFSRGFCMHEHYRDFVLINMNGRMYDPLVGRMLSPDIEIQNPEYSQSYNRYSYCFNNPLRFTDPSGYVVRGRYDVFNPYFLYYDFSSFSSDGNSFNTDMSAGKQLPVDDWYEDSDGNIQWTDYKSQAEMDMAGIDGKYLGEAVVLVHGSYDEKLGEDGTLTGKGAKPAQITVYGVNNEDDIVVYCGLSVSSDPLKYSMVKSGDYKAFYQDMSTSPYGLKGGSLSYRIMNIDGSLRLPIEGGELNKQTNKNYMEHIFFHRTNLNGVATYSSQGCIIIDGNINTLNNWKHVEAQLEKSSNIFFRITR